jgi:hypothetical protein
MPAAAAVNAAPSRSSSTVTTGSTSLSAKIAVMSRFGRQSRPPELPTVAAASSVIPAAAGSSWTVRPATATFSGASARGPSCSCSTRIAGRPRHATDLDVEHPRTGRDPGTGDEPPERPDAGEQGDDAGQPQRPATATPFGPEVSGRRRDRWALDRRGLAAH